MESGYFIMHLYTCFLVFPLFSFGDANGQFSVVPSLENTVTDHLQHLEKFNGTNPEETCRHCTEDLVPALYNSISVIVALFLEVPVFDVIESCNDWMDGNGCPVCDTPGCDVDYICGMTCIMCEMVGAFICLLADYAAVGIIIDTDIAILLREYLMKHYPPYAYCTAAGYCEGGPVTY